MKYSIELLALFATITTVTAQTSCSLSSAMAWPFVPNTQGGGDSCNGDIGCETIIGDGACNSQALIDGGSCVKKRQVDLECSNGENCYQYTDGSLLCLDPVSGEYHDDVGGSGNAISGVYTAPSGDVQTITGVSAEPTSTAAAEATTTSDGALGLIDDSSSTTAADAAATTPAGSRMTTAAATASGSSASGSGSLAQSTGAAGEMRARAGMLAAAAVPMLLAAL